MYAEKIFSNVFFVCWYICILRIVSLTLTRRILQILFTLEDGLVIETVVIPCDRGRTTVCVSSQVGCGMNCQFCYTGRQACSLLLVYYLLITVIRLVLPCSDRFCRMGLKRNLTAAEIVEQAVFARRLFSDEVGSITNVVFMVGLLRF